MFIGISIGLVVVAAVIALIGAVIGLIGGIKKSLAPFAAAILSIIIALLATLLLCNPESGVLTSVVDLIKQNVPLETIAEGFDFGLVDNMLVYYVSMILSPIVFTVIFLVAFLILSVILMIVVIIIDKNRGEQNAASRIGGLLLGLVSGVIVSMFLLMPAVGMLDIGAKIGKTGVFSPDLVGEEASALISEAGDDAVLSVLDGYCGWIYDGLSTVDYKGEKVSLEDDAVAVVCLIGNVKDLATENESWGEHQIGAMNGVIDNIDTSPILRDTLSTFLSDIATKWLNGEDFMGIPKIDGGELLTPIIDDVLSVIAESNKDNISEDMRTLTGILEIFVKHKMFENMSDYEELLRIMGEENVIPELISTVNANPRMSFISDDITKLSVRALSSTLGIPEDGKERYDMLMNDIAAALNDSKNMSEEDRLAAVEEDVTEALLDYGVEIEGQAAKDVADSILEDLGGLETVSGDDVSEFFIMYSVADHNGGEDSGKSTDYELLANDEFTLVVNSDGTITVNGKVLKNYTSKNYRDSKAYKLGREHYDIGDASSLYSADSMKSSLITLADILENVKTYGECDDPDAAAAKISDMLVFAMDKFDAEGGLTSAELVKNMGELLDMMHECELFADKATADMVTAIFQSKDVRGNIGLSFSEIGVFADKLNETAMSEKGSYTSTTQSIANTLEVVDKINNKDTDKEERREATEQLISNMTPDNAELLSTMTTPSMITQYGAPEAKSDVISNSVSDLFVNMAEYAENSGHDVGSEEYAKEANAVNTLLKVAMNSTDSAEGAFFATDDDEGRAGVSAEEYVELLVTSDVVSTTLLTTVEESGDNPFEVTCPAEDEEILRTALESFYENNKTDGDNSDLVKKLEAVAAISNITPPEFN